MPRLAAGRPPWLPLLLRFWHVSRWSRRRPLRAAGNISQTCLVSCSAAGPRIPVANPVMTAIREIVSLSRKALNGPAPDLSEGPARDVSPAYRTAELLLHRRMMLIAEALEYANAYGILLEVARRDVRDDAGIRRCNGVSALRRLGSHAQVILGRV